MNDNIMDMNVMNMKQTVARAKACGINISVYTLRKAILAKELPCRVGQDLYDSLGQLPAVDPLRKVSHTFVTNWLTAYDSCEPVSKKGDFIYGIHPSTL